MTQIRAIAVLGTVQFVKATFGVRAHEKVLATLPAHLRPLLSRRMREAEWAPLRDLAAYCEAAQKLLAPADGQFYRKLGRFTGRYEQQHGGFAPMTVDPQTAMRLAPTIWRALYDSGSLEILPTLPREAVARIRNFKTSRALCQTNCGAVEGLMGTDEHPVEVEETRCVLDGNPCCEMRVLWV